MRLAQVVGQSYGRLLALLAGQSRDIAAAEDALADALERALQRWPHDGVPANPEAWLLTVARNRLRDMWKSPAHRMSRPWTDDHDAAWEITDPATFPDRRLELMLVCAHPAIASDIRTPLMLQTVLGVDAAAIGAAFAVAPATMAQRLVRAKKRIRDAGIPFTMPERADLDARLPEVLEAVYGAYSIDWLSVPQGEAVESLSSEALHLAMVLVELLPDEPEVLGLAALMCLSERDARLGAARTEASSRSMIRFGTAGTRDYTPAASACLPVPTASRVRAGSSTRRRFNRRTAPRPSTNTHCANCIERCFGSGRRWALLWRWQPWTAKSTAPTPDYVPWTRSPTARLTDFSRRGSPADTSLRSRAGSTRRWQPTGAPSN